MLANLKKSYLEESLTTRWERMLPAIFHGILIATTYTWTFSFINVYSFPNLPLAMDWTQSLMMWVRFSAGFALLGAIAGWFTEDYSGVIWGGVIFTIVMAVAFMITSNVNSFVIIQSVIMAVLLSGVNALGAWGLRWVSRRYREIASIEIPRMRRRLMTRHVMVVLLIGLIPGVLGRMGAADEHAIRQLHELLQAAPNDPAIWTRLPIRQIPTLPDHFGVPYVIYARQSGISAGALDVTVRFTDGFTMSCLLPTTSATLFITYCYEGTQPH